MCVRVCARVNNVGLPSLYSRDIVRAPAETDRAQGRPTDRRDACQHECDAVAAERVFQQLGELGVLQGTFAESCGMHFLIGTNAMNWVHIHRVYVWILGWLRATAIYCTDKRAIIARSHSTRYGMWLKPLLPLALAPGLAVASAVMTWTHNRQTD